MGGDVGFGVVGYVCFVLYEKIKIGNCELLDSKEYTNKHKQVNLHFQLDELLVVYLEMTKVSL